MPGKGRKVAARQAQVGRRRRRQTREGVVSGAGTISDARIVGNDQYLSLIHISEPTRPY